MTDQQKQDFTLRVSQANPSEMVVIIYDIFLVYIQDALDAVRDKQEKEYHASLSKAKDAVGELMQSINPKHSLAGNYRSLYGFMLRQLTKADSARDTEILRQVQSMVVSLRTTYQKVSEADTSPAVMGNVQNVYAGLTYGKDTLTENLEDTNNRGFLA